MELFESLGNHLSYEDVLQCDGAFAAAHINYGKSRVSTFARARPYPH